MPTLVATLAEVSARVAGTSLRTAKVRELAQALRAFEPAEIEIGVLYLSGETRQGRIGLQYSALRAAVDVSPAERPTLTLGDLDAALDELASIRGPGSTQRRIQRLRDLTALATPGERDFILRLLRGELRQGALGGVMIEAIANAAQVPVALVRRAAMYAQRLGAVAHAALLEGAEGLARFELTLLSPVAPMLAQTAADVADAFEQLGNNEVGLEWKVDGARIQVHKAEDVVRIFTRNANDVTAAVAEIAAAVTRLPARSLVLDGEAVAVTATGRPHPFQTTMRRFGRKLDVAARQTELPIRAYFFDCLFVDGHSITDRPLRERLEALAQVVPESLRMPRLVTAS